MNEIELKSNLFAACEKYVTERISAAENAIASAKNTSQNDTKSSAGDKYETTREMMQQQISQNETQLLEAGKLKYALSLIKTDFVNEIAQPGSIVQTSNGNFYLAISAGQIHLENENYQPISPVSPLGLKMNGAKKNDKISFNGLQYFIKDVF